MFCSSTRTDFEVLIQSGYYAGIEVKGGEGNSINISDRPLWANEFCLWCHLDGAIVNQPEHGAHSIINRITNEMCRREKSVDVLFFKDLLCGTRTRPCPKYPGNEERIGLNTAPDVFLFPAGHWRIPIMLTSARSSSELRATDRILEQKTACPEFRTRALLDQ